MNGYYVSYRVCPTSYSPTQTILVTDLPRMVQLGGTGFSRVEFTEYAKRLGHSGPYGTTILSIYQESDDGSEKRVFYKESGGYKEAYLGPALEAILKPAPKEVLV